MTHLAKVSDAETTSQDTPGMDAGDAVQCPLPARPQLLDVVTSDLCRSLEETDCPLAFPVQERLRFETLLAELSSTFVNLPPGQVDAQIESALGRIVEFLGVDRGGMAEVQRDRKRLVMMHSYHMPWAPPDIHT